MKLAFAILLFCIINSAYSQKVQDSVIRINKLPVAQGFLKLLDLRKIRSDPSPFIGIYSVRDSVFSLENSIVSDILKDEIGTIVKTKKKNGEFNVYANLDSNSVTLIPGQHINRGDFVGLALKEDDYYLLLFAVMLPQRTMTYMHSLNYLKKNYE